MNSYVNFFFGIPNFGIGIPISRFFNSEIHKKILTGIFGIENGIGIPLPMGVPEIGTKNWNPQPSFQGYQWYDGALVHFQEVNNQGELIENHYPSKLLGFFSIEGKREAMIQFSVKPLLWSLMERIFFVDRNATIGTYTRHLFVRLIKFIFSLPILDGSAS